jgi:hypothetical protein
MRTERYFTGTLVTLASAVLATLFLIACQQSQPPAPTTAPAAAQSKAAVTEKVFVVFEGPWAIAPDPKDATSVLALAPKTPSHRDLYVAASNNSTLAPGTYDLAVPAHTGTTVSTYDPSLFRAKIDPKDVQRALDTKLERYAIRLPKPEAYVAATRYRSRVSATYPPEVTTEKEYATGVSLRYSVTSLTGFSVAGTQDAGGAFNPLLLQVDTPTVRFVIEPTQADDVCFGHSRMTFHDLAKLVGVTLYVDFPDNPSDCHNKDPQMPRPGKSTANAASPLGRMTALLSENLADVQAANAGAIPPASLGSLGGSDSARGIVHRLTAATYFFFGVHAGGCKAPIIIGDTTTGP